MAEERKAKKYARSSAVCLIAAGALLLLTAYMILYGDSIDLEAALESITPSDHEFDDVSGWGFIFGAAGLIGIYFLLIGLAFLDVAIACVCFVMAVLLLIGKLGLGMEILSSLLLAVNLYVLFSSFGSGSLWEIVQSLLLTCAAASFTFFVFIGCQRKLAQKRRIVVKYWAVPAFLLLGSGLVPVISRFARTGTQGAFLTELSGLLYPQGNIIGSFLDEALLLAAAFFTCRWLREKVLLQQAAGAPAPSVQDSA